MIGIHVAPSRDLEISESPDRSLIHLLAGIARGDETSLDAFYAATHRWAYGLALKITGDPCQAEEVTLDVYVQVWRQAGSYSAQRGAPASWLLAIARSRAIDRLRASAARRRREGPWEEGFDTPSEGADPLTASAESERRRTVLSAIAALPPEQRRPIELAFLQGLSHSEIAGRLEEPLGTVKTRIRLGMMKLRETLKPMESEP